jgi:hypothetical protein
MSTGPVLFDRFVDDAAVFPPSRLPLADAVRTHRHHRGSWYARLLGPLLCPASQLDRLDALTRELGGPFGISIVVDTGVGGLLEAVDVVARAKQLALQGVEIPLRGDSLADAARRTVAGLDAALGGPDDGGPAYVEIPRSAGWQRALDVIAESGYRVKLRTGGAEPADYPSPAELASFIMACLDREIAFKFTAGLHRAVRHRGANGTVEHGFLNIMLAVVAALDSGDAEAMIPTLLVEDGNQLAAAVHQLSDSRGRAVRRWFACCGSCSIAEPLDDLISLGLIAAPDTVRP